MLEKKIKKSLDFINDLYKTSVFKKTYLKEIKLFYILHSTTIKKDNIQFKIKMVKNNLVSINYSILVDLTYKKYKFYDIKFSEYSNIFKCWFEYKKKVKNFKTSNCISLLNDLEVQIHKTL